MNNSKSDCIVIGGGHAGIEAAHSAAKIGAKTCLITIKKDAIGRMSCNPAIGGLAKGQLAREIDALGGLMGLAIDATGIQFRMLNRSRGPAVQAPRAQADRVKYAEWMRETLGAVENLTIIEGIVTEIITEGGKVRGVRCKDGSVYKGETVVVGTGTFLNGMMYMGERRWAGGRIDEPPSEELSESLRKVGLELDRMATDTTPKLDAETCDLDKLEVQPGDKVPVPFSFMNDKVEREQVPCWVTYTDERIHKVLRENLHRAPLSSGQIKATDPRYCPSIEAKVVRFADKKQHRIFLEPEEKAVKTIYCNGIFTSMPGEVQERILKLLAGTENARILRYAYAIEYDYAPPVQLRTSLETKKVEGLFLAGQINGTSGYEEAGGQGIIAGINAARKLQNKEPVIIPRDKGYIGVMVDDLRTKGIDEPYRMFTSRAEYRLSLRADNADRRLTPLGHSVGLVGEKRWKKFQRKVEQIKELKELVQKIRIQGGSMWELLRKPGVNSARLAEHPEVRKREFSEEVLNAVRVDAKYEGYLAKQEKMAEAMKNLESIRIPENLDFQKVEHLKTEAKEKLSAFRPENLAQAQRISGVTPADITVIRIELKKQSAKGKGD